MIKRFFKNNFNLFYSRLRLQKGFMLAEVLVVIAISLLFTIVVMVNHKENQKKVILQRAAHKLAQDIRVTQEMVLSGRECQECGGTEPNGYGIYFEEGSDEYTLYADMNGNEAYNGPSNDSVIEKVYLEEGVFIKSIDPASTAVSIHFLPPDPKIIMNSDAGSSDLTTIEIALTDDPTETKTINVNTVGLIEID